MLNTRAAGLLWAVVTFCWLGACEARAQSNELMRLSASQEGSDIWIDQVGNGFRPGAQSLSLELGASYGVPIFGGRLHHDLALASSSYGRTLTGRIGGDHWYRGNLELRVEIFGGSQFWPQPDWVVGLAPHFRYDFALGLPVVPFIDAGAGVSGTGIGAPDLSGTFEFNLQLGTGCYWFVNKNVALTVEGRYLHLSCAGITIPNQGLNTFLGLGGVTLFF